MKFCFEIFVIIKKSCNVTAECISFFSNCQSIKSNRTWKDGNRLSFIKLNNLLNWSLLWVAFDPRWPCVKQKQLIEWVNKVCFCSTWNSGQFLWNYGDLSLNLHAKQTIRWWRCVWINLLCTSTPSVYFSLKCFHDFKPLSHQITEIHSLIRQFSQHTTRVHHPSTLNCYVTACVIV